MRARAHRRRSARGAAAQYVVGALVGAIVVFVIGYALGMQMGERDAAPEQAEASVDTDELIRAVEKALDDRLAHDQAGASVPSELAGDEGAGALNQSDYILIGRAVRAAVRDELIARERRARVEERQAARAGVGSSRGDDAMDIPVDVEGDEAFADSETRWVAEAPPQGPPPFEFDPPTLDFGFVSPGAEMEAPVTLTNTSEEPLVIAAMRSSCLCTTLEDLSGRMIPAGESITFTPRMESPKQLGPKNASVRFIFEDYGRFEYPIRSVSARDVFAEPAFLQATKQNQGTFTVRSIDDQPFRILSVNGREPDFVDPAAAASAEPRLEYELRWDLSQYDSQTCVNPEGEPMPDYWVVETDHPDAPIIDLRVRSLCTVPEPMKDRRWLMDDRRVLLDRIHPEEGAVFTIRMNWLGDAPPNDTIRRIESGSDQFHATLLGQFTEDGMQAFRVRIVPTQDFEGLLYGPVRFHAYTPGHSDEVIVIASVAEQADAAVGEAATEAEQSAASPG